jgi:hypothetical protein
LPALAVCAVTAGGAFAQVPPADPNAAAIKALRTYELPDRTASVRLPASWQVVATGVGFIEARGPNGELALFGVMVPAQDSGTTSLAPAGIMQPYSADPTEKFLASIDWVRARNGKNPVQAQFYSSDPINAPAAFGKCSNMTAILDGVEAVETDFCSLPEDGAGNYRNFFKAVGLGAGSAKQERTLMEAILASYRLNIQAIKEQRAEMTSSTPPLASAPAGGTLSSTVSAENSLMAGQLMMEEANAISAETMASEQGVDESVDNFDHGVLRGDTPVYMEGASEPMFWVGD